MKEDWKTKITSCPSFGKSEEECFVEYTGKEEIWMLLVGEKIKLLGMEWI